LVKATGSVRGCAELTRAMGVSFVRVGGEDLNGVSPSVYQLMTNLTNCKGFALTRGLTVAYPCGVIIALWGKLGGCAEVVL
jgi:hypothetical protein